MSVAELIVLVTGAYAGLGVAFSLAFAWRGCGAIDASARGAPWSFRVALIPGAAALWPVMAAKWLRASTAVTGRTGGGTHA